jgi:membrane protein
LKAYLRKWVDAFGKHKLLTYATAMAMRSLAALAALTLLTIALLGAFGGENVWTQHVGPAISSKTTHPTYAAIDAAVERVFGDASTGLIVFAAAFAFWEVSGALRAVMDALNSIFDREENRPAWRRFAISFALALVVIVLIACALFVIGVSAHLLSTTVGAADWIVRILRWPVGAVFLGLAVAIVFRFAPVEHPGTRFASAGGALVVVAWLIESALFAAYVRYLGNYRSASGNLLLFLVATSYLYISSIVFLVGAQLDEFVREAAQQEGHLTAVEAVRRLL